MIGLPPGLFYGTGIPACVLVMNRAGARERKSVLFINADREYREGKNQNSLRPEDIEKISNVYRDRLEVPDYCRQVPYTELAAEDYNLNIRRYVDNSPPPEPHDVRAHLHGGVPAAEVDSLAAYWASYPGVRELLFASQRAAPLPPNLGGNSAPTENPAPQANSAPRRAALPQNWGPGGHALRMKTPVTSPSPPP